MAENFNRFVRREHRNIPIGKFLSLPKLKELIEQHIDNAIQNGWDPYDVQCNIASFAADEYSEGLIFMPITGACLGIDKDEEEGFKFFALKTEKLPKMIERIRETEKEMNERED